VYDWRLDPTILLGIVSLAALYVVGVVWPRLATPTRMLSFFASLLVLFVALASPLDTIGDTYLLSAHMTQHLLLVLVVPPLALYGLPESVSARVRDLPLVGGLAPRLTRGPVAFATYNVVFALAHLPVFFDLTLRNEGAHIAEHLLFIGVGLLAWWPILGPATGAPRLAYPFQMLYLFLSTLPCSLVGALITLSGVVLYRSYATAPRPWDLGPLADQQIAGLTMWIGGSVYYFLAFMIVFFMWARQDDPDRRDSRDRPRLHIVRG